MQSHRMLALFTVALLGCSGAGRGPDIGRLPLLTSDDPRAEAELREAKALEKQGDQNRAIQKYRDFLHERPDDRLVPVAQLGLGRILLARHEDGEALALFNSVAEHPQPAVAEQGRFYAGIAEEHLGRHSEAIEALTPMQGRTIEPADTLRLLSTLASAYEAEGRHADAILALSRELQQPLNAAQTKAVQANMLELIDRKASPADIRRLLDELDKESLAFRETVVRALRDADAAHDTARARELLEILEERHIPLDAELSAIALRSQDTSEANPNAVGAILSLSGRARRVGELALRGLMQAADLPPSGPAPSDAPSLVFRDDAGDPERAVQAVDDLVSVHRVIAIVGPMDAQTAVAAGKRAQELGVPLIALTPAGDLPGLGPMIFRYFPTPDAEARALAKAARAHAAASFAVLYPDNAYGQAMLVAFEREADAMGLQLAATRPYPPGATSFGSEAEALAKVRFDALFIPDSAQRLALIAPALAAAGLWSAPAGKKPNGNGRAVMLLAPSVAFDAQLPKLAGRYLQGALFAVPFDAHSQAPANEAFVQHFESEFGGQPDAFAAFAHDAYKLVRAAVDAGARSREQLAAQLRVEQAPAPVAPANGFRADREARNPIEVLELADDAFVPTEGR